MKKILSLVLVLTLVLGSFSFAFAAPASDVAGTEYEDAVDTLNVLNIMTGYTDGTFKPENPITRAEFAALVVRALGQDSVAQMVTTGSSFSDVPSNQWYTGYVNVATSLKIVNGMGDGSFAPSASVTYEQAVTMIMRALGYEPEAAQKGGYPLGYMLVAGETRVTEDVKGVMSVPATRGIVAQLLNNALTTPMMVPVEFGNGIKYVKAGTNDTDYKDLLGNFLDASLIESKKDVEVRVEDIARYGTKDGYVKIAGKTYRLEKFAKDVDVEALFGAKVKAWVNTKTDEVVRIQLDDKILLDGIYINSDVDGIDLHEAGESYDFAKNVQVFINGVKKKVADLGADSIYNYGRVSLDRDGDVAFIEVFKWDNFMVVEKVDKDTVFGYGDELNAKGFTIVKDGKTLELEDLEEGDILFYNADKDAKFGEVYNASKTGEVGRIYTDRVTVDGTVYTFVNPRLSRNAKYLNENQKVKNLLASDSVTKSVLEAMQDSKEATVFLDRFGLMVYATGDIKDLKTTSSYFVLYSDVTYFTSRNAGRLAFDTVNSEGKKVTFDVAPATKLYNAAGTEIDWKAIVKNYPSSTVTGAQVDLLKGDVAELVLDKNGDVKEVRLVASTSFTTAIKADQKYFNGQKINSDTVVFLAEAFKTSFKPADLAVELFGKIDFDNINTGKVYTKDGNVVAIYAETTSRETDQVYQTVSTAAPNKDAAKDIFRLRIVIDGTRGFFFTKADPTLINFTGTQTVQNAAGTGVFLEVGMNKDKTEIVSINRISDTDSRVVKGIIDSISVSESKLTIDNNGTKTTVKLGTEAVVVDGADVNQVIRFSDLKVGDGIKVLLVDSSSPYTEVLYRTDFAGETPSGDTNTVTGKVYDFDKYTVRFDISSTSTPDLTEYYEVTSDTVYETATALHSGVVNVITELKKIVGQNVTVEFDKETNKITWIKK